MATSQDSEYQSLSQREHFYRFPERDLGSCVMAPAYRFLFDGKTLSSHEIIYNEGLERIFMEIIANAGDAADRSRRAGIDPGIITVKINADTVCVRNEGKPITTQMHPTENVRCPQLIFGKLLTSGNYSQDNNRKVAGTFGIGNKATNIMSMRFAVDLGNADEKKRYRQVWTRNMSDVSEPVIEDYNGSSYTMITYTADFGRFYDTDNEYGFCGQRSYTQQIAQAFAKHCCDISFTADHWRMSLRLSPVFTLGFGEVTRFFVCDAYLTLARRQLRMMEI